MQGPLVSVVSTLTLACDPAVAAATVRTMQNLPLYEEKVEHVEVRPEDERTGTYRLAGRFAGVIPWSNLFRYEFHDGGFHSYDAGRPVLPGLAISGGYSVAALRDGCLVIHYEEYRLPWWLYPIAPLVRLYLQRSMVPEMRHVRGLIERAAAAV